MPPAAKAPTMPVTRPRISGVRATNAAPSRIRVNTPGWACRAVVARPEISGIRNHTVRAVSR